MARPASDTLSLTSAQRLGTTCAARPRSKTRRLGSKRVLAQWFQPLSKSSRSQTKSQALFPRYDPYDFAKMQRQALHRESIRAVAERSEVMQDGGLDSKTKYLIALAVAAQIPCRYCVYFHTRAAKHAGATDAQIKEAIAAGKWSAVLTGSVYDFDKLRHEVDAALAGQ